MYTISFYIEGRIYSTMSTDDFYVAALAAENVASELAMIYKACYAEVSTIDGDKRKFQEVYHVETFENRNIGLECKVTRHYICDKLVDTYYKGVTTVNGVSDYRKLIHHK